MPRYQLALVEDNPGDAFLIQEMIAGTDKETFDIETYGELESALTRLAHGGDFDAVLLDLSLPDSHGLDTLRRVLSHPVNAPIVVLTGLDDQKLGVKAVQEGAQDYLVKDDVSGRLLVRALRYAIERYRIEQEREALVADLEAFAHTVAHDLKGPLTHLLFTSELLMRGIDEWSRAEIEETGSLITRKIKTMSSIIDELLLLASVRRSDVEPKMVDMAEVVDEALQRVEHLAQDHGAQIHTPDAWPSALGYGPWLVEVWANYLSNAIKFGGDPPVIELGAEGPNGETVCFWVRDNGQGIPHELQTRLFTPFTRLDQVKVSGHGLGLSIVHRIIEKLDGRVGLESAPGQGSTFTFTLPSTM